MSELENVDNVPAHLDEVLENDLGYAMLVTLMRIYDVLAADLTQRYPELAGKLLETHARGDIYTALPAYTGRHISTEQAEADNADEADESFDKTSDYPD